MLSTRFPLTYKVIFDAVKEDMLEFWASSTDPILGTYENHLFDDKRDKIRTALMFDLELSDFYPLTSHIRFYKDHEDLIVDLFEDAFDSYDALQAIHCPDTYKIRMMKQMFGGAKK